MSVGAKFVWFNSISETDTTDELGLGPIARNVRRHDVENSAEDSDVIATSLTPLVRKRRSSIWLMQAALSMCETHPKRCRRIDVEDGDVRVRIDLQSEQ